MVQQNIEIGRCRVSANGTEIGETQGAVTLKIRTKWRERRSERSGESAVERVAMGTELRVSMRLAEKRMDALQRALPTAFAGSGLLGLGRAPGFKASAAAFELRLHPEERADAGRDVVLHKAAATEVTAIEYGPGRARGFDVEFAALVDPAKADGLLLGQLGSAD
jgi:hypothetical protein